MVFDFKGLRFSGGAKYTQEIILPMITLYTDNKIPDCVEPTV